MHVHIGDKRMKIFLVTYRTRVSVYLDLCMNVG